MIASTSNAEEIEIVIRSDYNMLEEDLRCPLGKEVGHREKTISFVDKKQNVNYNHLEDDQLGQSSLYYPESNYSHISPQGYNHETYYRPEHSQVPHYPDQCPVNQYQQYSPIRPNPYQVHRSHASISDMNEQAAYRSRQAYAQPIDGQAQYYSNVQDHSSANYDVLCKSNLNIKYQIEKGG